MTAIRNILNILILNLIMPGEALKDSPKNIDFFVAQNIFAFLKLMKKMISNVIFNSFKLIRNAQSQKIRQKNSVCTSGIKNQHSCKLTNQIFLLNTLHKRFKTKI